MTILVCGSRSWTDRDSIRRVLEEYRLTVPHVLHSAASGADTLAAESALSLGFRVHAYPAQWDQYGKSAGYRRNVQMLDERPDLVLAFWDGVSKGTAQTITEAHKRGIPVRIIGQENAGTVPRSCAQSVRCATQTSPEGRGGVSGPSAQDTHVSQV